MAYNTVYHWSVWAFRGSDSLGISYYYREVTFQGSSAAGAGSSRQVRLIPKSELGLRWPAGSVGAAEAP